jgi:hypothetical protein
MIEVHVPTSWIFTHGQETIYVARPDGRALVIRGPGASRQRHEFLDEDALQLYQMTMAEQLAERGWTLYGVDRDRRLRERRAAQRATADRRLRES